VVALMGLLAVLVVILVLPTLEEAVVEPTTLPAAQAVQALSYSNM
jgi:hypothetical protein